MYPSRSYSIEISTRPGTIQKETESGRKISTRFGTLRKEPDLAERYLPDLAERGLPDLEPL